MPVVPLRRRSQLAARLTSAVRLKQVGPAKQRGAAYCRYPAASDRCVIASGRNRQGKTVPISGTAQTRKRAATGQAKCLGLSTLLRFGAKCAISDGDTFGSVQS